MIILNTNSASATSVEVVVPFALNRGAFRPVQVDISATATVQVQAKVDEEMDWVPLEDFTESTVKLLGIPKYIRAVVTGNTGTVKVAMDT